MISYSARTLTTCDEAVRATERVACKEDWPLPVVQRCHKKNKMNNHYARILIVDDTQQIRQLLINQLSDQYDCIGTSSAELAIEMLKPDSFSLVITDISMPGMSGIELCKYIRKNFPKTTVIIMSASYDKMPESCLNSCGAFGYLPKPFNNTDLLKIVAKAFL